MKIPSRLRAPALARLLTLVGLIAALAAITAGSASAWGSQGFNFGFPSGSNGWYAHSPVNGQVFFDVDGSPFDPDSGDYSEKLTGITCGGAGVTGGLSGTFFSNVNTAVSVAGETGPGGVAVACNATYERGTYSLCGFFGCAFSGYTPYSTAQAGTTIKIDLSPPVGVTASFAPANANGWHNAPSSVGFNGSDPNSGIAFCRSGSPFLPGPAGQSIGPPDGAFKQIVGGCQNVAGRITGIGVFYKYDATDPTLAPTVSPNPVLRGAAATASPNALDQPGLSGIAVGDASCDSVDTSTAGANTVSCTATDRAGNSASASTDYDVVLGFTGFTAPVDNDMVNVAKAGQTVPLKFHVSDANGPVTDLSSVDVTAAGLACDLGDTSDQLEEYAAGGSGLQNKGGGDYQFNWQTPKAYALSCKTLSLDVGDGVDHTAEFRFTK